MYGPLSFLSLGEREGRQSITRKMGKITPKESRFSWKIDLKTLDPFHWPYLITSWYWSVIVIPLNGSVSLVFQLLVIHFKYLLGPWQHLYICPWGVRLPKVFSYSQWWAIMPWPPDFCYLAEKGCARSGAKIGHLGSLCFLKKGRRQDLVIHHLGASETAVSPSICIFTKTLSSNENISLPVIKPPKYWIHPKHPEDEAESKTLWFGRKRVVMSPSRNQRLSISWFCLRAITFLQGE